MASCQLVWDKHSSLQIFSLFNLPWPAVSWFGKDIPLSRQFRGGFSRGEIQRLGRLHVKALLNVQSNTSDILSSSCLLLLFFSRWVAPSALVFACPNQRPGCHNFSLPHNKQTPQNYNNKYAYLFSWLACPSISSEACIALEFIS